MRKEIIRAADAPSSPLFSQGVKCGNWIFLSGIVGLDPRTSQLAGLTIEEQTRQAIINCEQILKAGGASLADVVDVHVLLAHPSDFGGFNEVYVQFFAKDPPARAVSRLGPELPNLRVSIKMTAVLSE